MGPARTGHAAGRGGAWLRHGTPAAIDLEEGRQHWSFRPVADPPVPSPRDADWPRTDIDRFVLAALEPKGLRPVGDAALHALVRRITFDLTGLPPTPEEVEAFAAQCADAGHRPAAGLVRYAIRVGLVPPGA